MKNVMDVDTEYVFKGGHNKGKTVLDAISSNHTVEGNGCWRWNLVKESRGYAYISIRGVTWRVHRLTAHFLGGLDVGDLLVLHKCDNPSCVNPEHLFVGSHQDNMNDKGSKDRQARLNGEENFSSKLSNDDVRRIKTQLSEGVCQRKLAREFSISTSTINQIYRGKKWKTIQV